LLAGIPAPACALLIAFHVQILVQTDHYIQSYPDIYDPVSRYPIMPLFITELKNTAYYYKLTGMSQGGFIPIELHPVAS
jgi:hypothetical protein